MDLHDKVRARGLHDAVVVIHSGTGRLRGFTPKDLTRNGLAIDRDVIYSLDISHRLGDLRGFFRTGASASISETRTVQRAP